KHAQLPGGLRGDGWRPYQSYTHSWWSVSSWSCQDSPVSPGLEASQPGRNPPQPNRL
ncbi:hypothetical protein XENOCAPTIV_028972, partial [Xenoophorus captivus]